LRVADASDIARCPYVAPHGKAAAVVVVQAIQVDGQAGTARATVLFRFSGVVDSGPRVTENPTLDRGRTTDVLYAHPHVVESATVLLSKDRASQGVDAPRAPVRPMKC